MADSNTWNPLQGFNTAASSYHSSYAGCSAAVAAAAGGGPFPTGSHNNHPHGIEMSSLFPDANGRFLPVAKENAFACQKWIHIYRVRKRGDRWRKETQAECACRDAFTSAGVCYYSQTHAYTRKRVEEREREREARTIIIEFTCFQWLMFFVYLCYF